MKPDSQDKLFHALASEPRRRILDILRGEPGCSVMDVCRHFDVSRVAVMKHLKVLEDAELVISRKEGRTRRLYFNVSPIQSIHERWTDEYSAYWAGQLNQFKRQVEGDE